MTAKTTEKDIKNWWNNDLNISTRQHAIDPNRLESETSIEVCKKDHDDLTSEEKHLIRVAYSFRHQNEDSTDTLGYDLSSAAWTWWNTFNSSMRQHMLDPHQIFEWSLDICKKRYEDLTPAERRIIDESFNVRHKEDSGGKNKQPIKQLGASVKTPCQCMAEEALSNHTDHYHAAYENPAIERLSNYKGRSGYFIKKFLINDKNNLNNWRVTWDAVKRDIWDFVGKPLVLTPDKDHPSVPDQEDYRVGDIIDVGIDDVNRTAWQVSEVFDKKAQEMIEKGEVSYGSPTVLMKSEATREKQSAGTPYQRDILHRFTPAHDAIVGNPAYGREVNRIKAVCKGDGPACALKLLTVSASVEYRDMHNYGAAFENLSCKEKYATIKDGTVKVGWDSDQHKLLHTRNLPHSHVCVTSDGKKHIERSNTGSASAETVEPNYTTGNYEEPVTYDEIMADLRKRIDAADHILSRKGDVCQEVMDKYESGRKYDKDLLSTIESKQADIGGDNTSQMTIVPFVRAELKKRFAAESLAEIVGHISQAETQDSCVGRKIKIISDEHSDWPHDKIIASAYSYCRGKEKEGAVEDIESLFMPLASDLISLSRDEQIKKKKRLMDEIAKLQSEFKIMLEPN